MTINTEASAPLFGGDGERPPPYSYTDTHQTDLTSQAGRVYKKRWDNKLLVVVIALSVCAVTAAFVVLALGAAGAERSQDGEFYVSY